MAVAPTNPTPVAVALVGPMPGQSSLILTVSVRFVRHHRAKCAHCGLRRILYSLTLEGEAEQLGPGAESPRYCAVDAGIIR